MDTEIKKNHLNMQRFSKTWMLATIIIVALCLTLSGIYFIKAYHVKHPIKKVAKTASTVATKKITPIQTTNTATNTQATVPKAQVVQASQDLKAIDLAALKSSINDVKTALSGFSQ